MKAAVVSSAGQAPVFGDFQEPEPREGAVVVEVETVGLGGWDVLGAYREASEYPCVVRGEGVGRAPDGRRVYFGERSVVPFGAWAEKGLAPVQEVWDVPDDVDDKTAITMAIAGTGAWVPLEKAEIQKGDSVLITGATGVLGQLGCQYARIMGAGRVTGAARNAEALQRLKSRGIADETVQMGTADDAAALKAAAGEGFDVVLDLLAGPPLVAALKATRWGARIMIAGAGAGININLNVGDLLYRTLSTVGTGQRPPDDRQAIWRKLLKIAKDHGVTVDQREFAFEDVAGAWAAQAAFPHAKITARVKA